MEKFRNGLNDLKNEIQEVMTCERCGHSMKSVNSVDNVCVLCERVVCKNCKLGVICKDCIKKIPKKTQRKINFMQFFRKLSIYTSIASFMFLLGLFLFQKTLGENFEPFLIGTFILTFGAMFLHVILTGSIVKKVNKAVNNNIY